MAGAIVPIKEPSGVTFSCPILTAINYPVWAVKIKSIMETHGLWEAVEPALGAQIDAKKSKMARAYLFQAIPKEIVLQVATHEDAKGVWDALKIRYLGVDRVKKARLRTLRMEFEGLQMKDEDSVNEFAGRLSGLASKARSLGSTIEDETLVTKLLDSMSDKFLQIVASIEQYSDLDTMSFDEVIGRLKAYEERIRGKEKLKEDQGRWMTMKMDLKGLLGSYEVYRELKIRGQVDRDPN